MRGLRLSVTSTWCLSGESLDCIKTSTEVNADGKEEDVCDLRQ